MRSCSAVLSSGYIASNGSTSRSDRIHAHRASTRVRCVSGLVTDTVVRRSSPSVGKVLCPRTRMIGLSPLSPSTSIVGPGDSVT